eukprot:PhM_4_TR17828/c0_g1_i1/m.68928/K11806/WDSOF1; WD repeat and SOF domain-containing protein 1
MRIKVISRSEKEWTRDRDCDLMRRHRNLDPVQHPMAREVEYQRALNGVKLERMFAKPFMCSLQGHVDSVSALALDPNQLSHVVSGSCDGQINVWDIAHRKRIIAIPEAHRHFVRGIVSTPDSAGFLSCSTDKTVRLWDYDFSAAGEEAPKPVCEYMGQGAFSGIDHMAQRSQFITAGNNLELWDLSRTRPVRTYQWGMDPIVAVKCNRVEPDIVACTTMERAITIYDLRTDRPAHKVVMEMKSSCLAWNPMEPATLVVGNDDWNAYQYDIRNFSRAQLVFTSHTASITDIDFSPTGREFVTCSYDRTLRIWDVNSQNSNRSRDMYHTQRMHKCWSVRWTLDGGYIVSGSEDACVRVWKGEASAPVRPLHPNESRKINYHQALKQRYGHFTDVARIDKQRHIPKYIRTAQRVKRHVLNTQKKKQHRMERFNPRLASKRAPKALKEAKVVAKVE